MPQEKEIALTSPAAIVAMTKALPDIPDTRTPKEYDQEIESPAVEMAEQAQPDPAHNY